MRSEIWRPGRSSIAELTIDDLLRKTLLIFLAVAVLIVVGALVFVDRRGSSHCAAQTFEGSTFTVCEYRVDRHEIALVWADGQGQALRSFSALEASGLVDPKRVRFAMNAGMFDVAGAPIGLFVANGQEAHAINQVETGEGNFHMQPNGVFFVDAQGGAHILTTQDYVRAGPKPTLATQSGPMLVIAKALNANFSADGTSRYVRNGVGVRGSAGAYFVISEEPVSFGKFARFFRDALRCENALYLDGSVSSLWAPALGRRDDAYGIGPMVVVSDRARPGA